MEDNTNDDSTKKSMNPTRELYESLMSEVYKYKLEEREMALDRYRRSDEQMDTAESFILMGKNAIAFLKQAADSSDGIEKLAKEIKGIVYKEDEASGGAASFNDSDKKLIIDAMRAEEKAKREAAAEAKRLKDENLSDNKGADEDYD